jgi:hypothetical protein
MSQTDNLDLRKLLRTAQEREAEAVSALSNALSVSLPNVLRGLDKSELGSIPTEPAKSLFSTLARNIEERDEAREQVKQILNSLTAYRL